MGYFLIINESGFRYFYYYLVHCSIINSYMQIQYAEIFRLSRKNKLNIVFTWTFFYQFCCEEFQKGSTIYFFLYLPVNNYSLYIKKPNRIL